MTVDYFEKLDWRKHVLEWLKVFAAVLVVLFAGYSRFEKNEYRLNEVEHSMREHIQDHKHETDKITGQLDDIQKDLNQLIGRQSQSVHTK